MRRFFLIFISLCSICSSSLAASADFLRAAEQLSLRGEWGLAAALYERALWDNPSPSVTLEALLGKSECYTNMGMHKEASDILSRAPMFGLAEEEVKALTYARLCCHYRADEFSEFSVLLEEAISFEIIPQAQANTIRTLMASEKLRHRSENAALLLSAIPGCGLLYAGEPLKGLEYMSDEVLIICSGVYAALSGLYFTAICGAAMSLTPLATSSSDLSIQAAENYNLQSLRNYYLPVYSLLSCYFS